MKTAQPTALERVLEPVSTILTRESAQALADLRLDRTTQAYLDRLARKCNQGRLTDQEREEYRSLVSAIDFIGILQVKARAYLAGRLEL
jgi:hypothetical protein